MSVSKRLRMEILRRDNHACRYCGGTAPDVKLTVDHVVPTALGGGDDPSNLVAACVDCNAGKSSISPTDAVVADVAQDALRWADAMREAARMAMEATDAKRRLNGAIYDMWMHESPEGFGAWVLPPDFDHSLDHFRQVGLPQDEILDAFWIMASKSHVRPRDRWRYFCGICYRKIGELQEAARAIVEAGGDGG